jgi:hypothetical protein
VNGRDTEGGMEAQLSVREVYSGTYERWLGKY